MTQSSGWEDLAGRYIAWIDAGDPSRELLLDAEMLQLCGDVAGARVLDVGCGEGRFCRMLQERGASTVGLDPTSSLIAAAQTRDRGGAYVRAAAEALPFADAAFDVVVSYVTLVDIAAYREAIGEIARVLASPGRLVVANLSFISASAGWARDADGRRLHHRIDRYLEERSYVIEWEGRRVVNWHRPLSAYVRAFLAAGLELRDFLEPAPLTDALRDDPRFEDWYRVPDFTVMVWEKRR